MKLKRSLWSNLLENGKRRGWVFGCMAASLFFFMPVMATMGLSYSRYTGELGKQQQMEIVASVIKDSLIPTNFLWLWITFLAVLCGIQGFSYLYKKEKVDFYHSVPVSANQRFFTIYGNGLLFFLASYLPAMLLTLALAVIYKVFNIEILLCGLVGFAFAFAVYGTMYSLSVFCAVLSGNLLAAGGFLVVLMSYEWVVRRLVYELMVKNFQTYWSNLSFSTNLLLMDPQGGFSPVQLLSAMNYQLGELHTRKVLTSGSLVPTTGKISPDAGSILWTNGAAIMTWGLLLLLLAWALYRKRPAERAGQALAYRTWKLPLEVVLLIPFSLLAGEFFYETSRSELFRIFGILAGCFVGGLFVEMICEKEFSAFLKRWYLPAACSVFACLLFCSVRFDWYGYDQFLPEKEKVESAAVYFSGFEDIPYFSEDGYNTDYMWEHMEITDIASVLSLAKNGIESIHNDMENKNILLILYRMKSGKEIFRRYYIPYYEKETLVTSMVENKEYKKGAFPIYNDKIRQLAKDFDTISVDNGIQEFYLPEDASLPELWDAYQKDMDAATAKELQRGNSIAVLRFKKKGNQNAGTERSNFKDAQNKTDEWDMRLYPTFVHTLSLLEDYGLTGLATYGNPQEFAYCTVAYEEGDWDNIEYIERYKSQKSVLLNGGKMKGAQSYRNGDTLIILNPDEIENLMRHVYLLEGKQDIYTPYFPLEKTELEEKKKRMIVTAYQMVGEEIIPYYFSFRPGEIPDIIQNRLEKIE